MRQIIKSKFFKNLLNKTRVRTFHEKLIKTWNIIHETVFLRAFKTQESYVCSMKIDKI